ncbi:MAG TPA: hypothetical protein VN778_02325 [Verrucomicrobiae bacterium]|nr:hypothetical protein [Verrucomicrobiae bacterium]
MPQITIESAVLDRLPNLHVNEETLGAIEGHMQMAPNENVDMGIVIAESARRRWPITGVGRYMSFGHPIGGYYGRHNEIRVYRKGASTPDEMTHSIIRGLAARYTQRGTDYEQRCAAQRLEFTTLFGGIAVGSALGNVPNVVEDVFLNHSPSLNQFLGDGTVLGLIFGSVLGMAAGLHLTSKRYPNAGAGSLGYYIAEGITENAMKYYNEQLAPTAPLVSQ